MVLIINNSNRYWASERKFSYDTLKLSNNSGSINCLSMFFLHHERFIQVGLNDKAEQKYAF